MENNILNKDMNDENISDLNELSEFVKQLDNPTEKQLENYEQKYIFMESIHDEIRDRYPDFMPVYDASLDKEFNVGNKYLDIVYNLVKPEKKEVDSH